MNEVPAPARRFGCGHLLLTAGAAVVLTALVAFCVFRNVLYPRPFKPVRLNPREETILQAKLDRIDFATEPVAAAPAAEGGADLTPEAYSETGADRTIRFTERELNALLAKNTELADKLAIDLSPDLISARLLLPLDEDVPVLGGKTLRVKTGVAFRYADGRPEVRLRGVMIMGVPLPNAWLGGLKDIDVVREFGGEEGFWKAFADGVADVRVEDGCVAIQLKE